MIYLTDGEHLYERVTDRVVQNSGLGPKTIRYMIVVDCKTMEMLSLTAEQIADLRSVTPLEVV